MFNLSKKEKIKKILIIRLGAIGDVVHSTALYRSLKKYNPEFEIHYLTSKTPSTLVENDPDIKKIRIAEDKTYKYLANLAKTLKNEKYDLCINLQPSIRTKYLTFFIGAKHNLTYKKTFKLHAVENFWKTAKPLFKDIKPEKELKLYIPDEIKEKTGSFTNTVVFNMGVSTVRQGRRWPLEYWEKLAKDIIEKYNCNIILTGAQEDAEFSESILHISPEIKSFCGKLSILENSAMVSKCRLLVSGDTGPLHIATALGVPVIGLYGAAPVSRTGPYGKNCFTLYSEMKCVPCNRRKCKYLKDNELYTPCMNDLTPDRVLDIIKKIF